jgi:hypothetical protein
VAGSLERSPIVLVNGADGSARIATRLRDDEGRLHDTPSFAAARRDGARREIAERARLAYVAATRAREAVVFVGNRRAPKGAGSDAYRSSSAAALARMAADEATAPLLRVDETPDEAATAFGQPREDRGDRGVFRAVEIPRHGTLALGASELDDFGVCPRRFHLKHLLEVPEPPFAPDRGAKTRQLSLTLVSSKAATAAAVVHARWTGSFDRAPIATCIAIACGYVGLCHPRFTR